ncbi:YDG domain-containing protein [Flavobacterium selenitireducens]|uniref:YDG domain-containing protein n=1 Tax=Flavobacterium selenitireducens TaxID=2722704 RepID=UPI00168B6235|nr:YDG domain-containing protein [Flavobacterium selenitireducens]MBD3581249.1 T9SS type A sorting domain-containing protein [Flavobacterium selenitireducens]
MRSNLPDSGQEQHSFPARSLGSPGNDWRKSLSGFIALFLTTLALGFTSGTFGQGTSLAAGDVAIIGMNTASTDRFSVVLLKDIVSGTVFRITDCGMASPTTGRANEGHLTYTAPSAQSAGTVLTWFNGMNVSGTGWNSNNPSNFALSGDGDQLFVYQGAQANWANQSGITLIYGLNTNASLISSGSATSNNTYVPAALTLGTTFISMSAATYENAYFANQSTSTNTVTVSGTKAQLLALFASQSNWFGNGSSQSTFPTWNFTVVTGPSISTTGTTVAVNTTYGTASAATTFNVTATGLTNNVTVTPPNGFEVSKTSATTGFASTQSLIPTSGSFTNVPVYVRLKATTTAGTYSGNVALASGTATVTKSIPNSTVSPKSILVTGATVQDKIYDRTTNATIVGAVATGLVNDDVISVTGGGTFASFDADQDVAVTASLSLSGTNATSYTFTQPTGLTADITPKAISLANVAVGDKVYDQTTSATITAGLDGVIAPDEVLVNVSGFFTSPFAGENIPVAVSADLFGADVANYTLEPVTGVTADIAPKNLVILNAVAQNKVYDGNTNAQITGTLDGVIAPDEVVLTLQGTFASAEVGMDIAVTSTSFITGDIANYVLQQPTGLDANISAEALLEQTISFGELADVVYGDANFSLSATTTSGLEVVYSSSDENIVSINGNEVVIHNAGTATIAATQPGDLTYDAAAPVLQVLNVRQKTLTLDSASAQDKTYDASTSAQISGTLAGIVGNDQVNVDGNGSFASANVGNAIEVTAQLQLSGNDLANYTIAQPTGLFADITPKLLTITGAQASDKIYDATNSATVFGGALEGVIANEDVVLFGGPATFVSVNVGNDISVASNFVLDGTGASNYAIAQPADLSAEITPLEVAISGLTASDKIYDATTNATVSGTPQIEGLLAQDDVTVSGMPTAAFADKNVADGKPIVISNVLLSGAQAANYTAVAPTTLFADITPASLTITNAQALDKAFDGNVSATVTGTLSGILAQDAVTLVGSGIFASSAIGSDIAVTSTSTLTGADASNYVIDPQPSGLSADILEGPTVLAIGDLAILGFQFNTPDTFSFVAWVDISSDTYIKFTDNGFLSTAASNTANNVRGGENYLIWKNDGQTIAAGTVISIENLNGSNPATASLGAVVSGNLNGLSASGDTIFAYQGAATSGNFPDFSNQSNPSTFLGEMLYGIYVQGSSNLESWMSSGTVSSNSSYLPSDLNVTFGNMAFASKATRGQYVGPRNGRTSFAAYKVLVADQENWQTAASSGTIEFDLAPFTLASAPTAAVISGDATLCVGETAQFSIAVTGGTSPFEIVYSDGINVFSLSGYVSGSAVSVTPVATSTYTIVSVTDANGLEGQGISGSATVTVNQQYGFYADSDFDGFGAGEQVLVCAPNANTPPSGFSTNDLDCDDARGSVNPNATEIPFNGIDDDCDGTIDEGSQVFSQVLPSQCGTTLGTISSVIGAVSFGAPIDGYRFKVVNVASGVEQVIDRNVPHFLLTQLAQYDYAATYDVSVQLRRNGQWLNYYGPVCQLSTPAILSPGGAAAINPSQCGGVLPSISSLIATTSIAGVTGYRFKITDVVSNEFQTIDRNVHWFSLTMLEDFLYGRTYAIEVSVRTNGQYSAYGQPCNVTTPAVPQIVNCGAVIPTKGTLIATTSLNRVTSYRFQLTNLENFETTIIDRPLHFFSFNNVPGFVAGAQYSVSVALMTSGKWSDFGEACFITAPGSSTISRGVAANQADETYHVAFRAVLYPNPYSESFAIDMDVPTQETVSVKVYDMVGKMVEQREFASDAIEVQQFGESYPSGVYNVVVAQGVNVKTLRVIKR